MATNIKDIIDNVKSVYMTDSSINTLIDYERVLDRLDLYSFKHWQLGELVKGPIYEKYFVTCSWMYPYRKMPDPSGAERLLNHGCEVWVVTITMPKKLMGEIERGSLELENDIIDAEDIETAYEEGMDDEQKQKTGQQQEAQAQQLGAPIGQVPQQPTI
jgi:hypothetical protein